MPLINRGPAPDPKSLRRNAYRPTINAAYIPLITAICEARGWTIQQTIERALIRLATIDEASKAGMVEE